MSDAHVVWLKRDLRVHDHAPLVEASRRGRVVVLYVFERELWSTPEFDASHHVFIAQSLRELDARLREIGGHVTYRVGDVVAVLDELRNTTDFHALWSHQESGNRITYDRDLRVGAWCRANGIAWHEPLQSGVFRRMRSRDDWIARWEDFVASPVVAAPARIAMVEGVRADRIATLDEMGLDASDKDAQRGGETEAWSALRSFLDERGVDYRRAMSSPITAIDACSRISPHLAWGTISIRATMHALERRVAEVALDRDADPRWSRSLASFRSRLQWRDHFVQKLEDEPDIEFRNFARAYDGLREDEFDEARFAAWCEGRTGFPMVDACMRALLATGWINFRMRAMLVSFAAFHSWLHWRRPAVFLARHFLDFEPGIHYAQFQMQSGTTGINTMRVYSPAKQQRDQDPTGAFVRRWVPELARVPDEFLAEPWRMPPLLQRMCGCTIGSDYPAPIVDAVAAPRVAKGRVTDVRKSAAARAEFRDVLAKHGSRAIDTLADRPKDLRAEPSA